MLDGNIPKPIVGSESQAEKTGRLKRVLSHKRSIALVLAVLLLCATATALFLGNKDDDAKPAQKAVTGNNPLKTVEVTQEQLTNEQLISKVNFLMGTNQYADAEKLIRFQTDLSTNSTKQSLLTMVLTRQGKNDEAAKVAGELAESGNLDPGQFRLIGEQYENAGNKVKAIEYYKKAIAAYKARQTGSDGDEAKRLEAKLETLE